MAVVFVVAPGISLYMIVYMCGVSSLESIIIKVHLPYTLTHSSTAAGGTLSCDPLMIVGAILITTGACALITALCCSIYLCYIKLAHDFGSSWGAHIICCLLAILMLLILLGMAIAATVLVAENYNTVTDGSYVDDGEVVSCNNSGMPFVLTILSWSICLLVCCCGCVSCCKCLSVIMHYTH